MTSVKLEEELHSNTRRTRITFRANVDGKMSAIKCYRKPLFGFVHWVRAQHRGKQIRRRGGAVPQITYSGWLPELRCFCFGTEFLEGYKPLRYVLAAERSLSRQLKVIGLLGATVADLHNRGIEQPDGNLTNFLIGPNDDIAVIDEDDIKIHPYGLTRSEAIRNLANVSSRLPEREMMEALLVAYLDNTSNVGDTSWDHEKFWETVQRWKMTLGSKRAKRNLDPLRRFD